MKRWLTALVLLTCVPATAAAQSFFVEGSAFAGIERRAHGEVTPSVEGASGPDLNGTVAAGGFAVGTWLSPKVTVRLEAGLPGSVTSSEDASQIVSISPTQSVTFSRKFEVSERLRSASALLAFHAGRAHRVQLAYIGGVAFLFASQSTTYSTVIPALPVALPSVTLGTQPGFSTKATSYTITGEVGLDAAISLGERFSVVPQVRVIGFDNGISFRPGVAFRATW